MTDHARKKSPSGLRLVTMRDVDWLWERVKTQHSIFFEPTEDDSVRFAELLAHPASHAFIVDDGALLFLTDVEAGNMGFFNGVVWDKSLYRQHKRAKEILAFLFELLGLHRVSAVVPADNLLAQKYLRSMGFKREAHFREAIRRPEPLGDPKRRIDMYVYGLLRREVIGHEVARNSLSQLVHSRWLGRGGTLDRGWRRFARFWSGERQGQQVDVVPEERAKASS